MARQPIPTPAAELDQLRAELLRLKTDYKLRDVQIIVAGQRVGISKNTISDFLASRPNRGTRLIGNFRRLIGELRDDLEEPLQHDARFYRALQDRMHVADEQQRVFLERYSGSFLCYRMSDIPKRVVVTFFRIWDENRDGIPRFEQCLILKSEKTSLGNATDGIIKHYGFCIARDNRIYFLSASGGNFRELIAVPALDPKIRHLRGLYLTVDNSKSPFAAKVFLEFQGNLEFGDLRQSCGDFKLDTNNFQRIESLIDNKVRKNGVLRAL